MLPRQRRRQHWQAARMFAGRLPHPLRHPPRPGPAWGSTSSFVREPPHAALRKAASVKHMSQRMAVVAGALGLVLTAGTLGQALELPFFGQETPAHEASGADRNSGSAAPAPSASYSTASAPSASSPSASSLATASSEAGQPATLAEHPRPGRRRRLRPRRCPLPTRFGFHRLSPPQSRPSLGG